MMRMEDFFGSKIAEALAKSGFKTAPAIAGFFGGVLSVWFGRRHKKWWHELINVLSGLIAAGYGSDIVLHAFSLPGHLIGSVGFGIGLFGMRIVDKFIDFIIDNSFQDILDLLIPIRNFFKNRKK